MTSAPPNPPNPPCLLYNEQGQRMKIDATSYNARWSNVWKVIQPGQLFDANASAPILAKTLLELDVAQTHLAKRALVPGCGRGYDLATLARAGYTAVGLDIVPSAVEAAEAWLDSDSGLSTAQRQACSVHAEDFFTYNHPQGPFELGYDYTFLCALHPDMRSDWAAAWSKLLRPGGLLLTLVFPVDPSMDQHKGPPWPVTPTLYEELLLPAGFTCEKLEPVPAGLSHASREGKEWLGVWRR